MVRKDTWNDFYFFEFTKARFMAQDVIYPGEENYVMTKRNKSQEGRQGVEAGCECVCILCAHACMQSEATSHEASIKTLALSAMGSF